MSLPVELLPEAAKDLEDLAAYAGQYSAAARTNFLTVIASKVQLLEQMPQMYPVVPQRPHLRKCVVTATVSLYYRLQANTIEIVGIVDSRRNPDTLPQYPG